MMDWMEWIELLLSEKKQPDMSGRRLQNFWQISL